MFSPFTRRRRKASPEPDDSPVCESPSTGRRRRRISDADKYNGNGSAPVLPTFRSSSAGKKKPPSQLPTFQAGNTCNNFLLGGQFYPGKDKKRKHMRKRTIWHRIFCSSPWRVVVSVVVVSYVLFWHVLVPATHALLDFGRTISGGKHGFMDVSSLSLPPLEQQRKEAVRLQDERDRLHFDRRHDERFKVLELIAPGWYHRNDGAKKHDVVKGQASDDEAAHEQHPRPDGVAPRRKMKRERHQRSESSDGEVEKRGTRHHLPQKQEGDSTGANVTITQENTAADGAKTAAIQAKTGAATASSTNANDPVDTKTTDAVDGRLLRRTLQNMDTFPVQSSCPLELSPTDITTTLVIQSSLERLWILEETCRRWKSPIVVAVYVPHGAEDDHRLIVEAKSKCPQLTVIPVQASHDSAEWAYPVNRLRNMALDAVQTSHILVADIDFVPSVDLDDTIRSTIVEQETLMDPSQQKAMIVPAFERLPPEPCSKEHDCSIYLKSNSSFIPQTLQDLQACTVKKDCSVFQRSNNWEGHYSTRSESWLRGDWYEPEANATNTTDHASVSRIRTIKCFDSLRYEPYVVLRWCPVSTKTATEKAPAPVAPYYDERFYGYGKNKIQLISHLRFMGYHFSVLPKGFIVHNPHFESVAKQTWNNVQENKLHQEMDALYPDFLEELWDKYKGTTDYIVQQCKRPNKKDG